MADRGRLHQSVTLQKGVSMSTRLWAHAVAGRRGRDRLRRSPPRRPRAPRRRWRGDGGHGLPRGEGRRDRGGRPRRPRWRDALVPGSTLARDETRVARGAALRGRSLGRTVASAGCHVAVLDVRAASGGLSATVTAYAITTMTWRTAYGATDVETSGIDHALTLLLARAEPGSSSPMPTPTSRVRGTSRPPAPPRDACPVRGPDSRALRRLPSRCRTRTPAGHRSRSGGTAT